MNNQQEQDTLLKDLNSYRKQFIIREEHLNFLRTIDPDNDSRALRIVIEKAMNHTKIRRLQENLLYLVFAMCIITLALLILPLIPV